MSDNTTSQTHQLQQKIAEQVREFQENRHSFQELLDVVVTTLKYMAPDLPGMPIIHSRVKAIDSFANKCIRKHGKYAQPAWQFTDLCGAQIIVLSRDTIKPICRMIEELFHICEQEDTAGRLKEMEFGYQSVHYIVALREDKRTLYGSPNGNIPAELFHHRTAEEAKKNSLPMGPVFKAEIQIRTLLQHAWSSVVHDNLYKSEFRRPPRHLQREAARIAALVEEVDDSIVRLIQGVHEYRSYYGAYMTPEEIRHEIAVQRIILTSDSANKAVALKIARLADSLNTGEELVAVEQDLAPFEAIENAAILRELGMVRWKLGQKEIGRSHLLRSAALNPGDTDTLCELGLTYFQEHDYWNALHYYEKAFALNPEYPRALMRFIECRILDGKDSGFDFIPLIRHNLIRAVDNSLRKIDAGMHLPYAWYDIGFFHLLLGQNHASLEAYGKAIITSSSPSLVVAIYRSLTAMQKKIGNKQPELCKGMLWVRSLLRVVLVGRFRQAADEWLCGGDDARLDEFAALAPLARDGKPVPFVAGEPLVLVAGSCKVADQDILTRYEPLIRHAFTGFRGIVCCGGTDSGISGIIGRLDDNGGALRKLSYLPPSANCMSVYTCIPTLAGDFSPMDPLMLWSDIMLGGIDPGSVRLLGVRGGEISAFEYQLGLLLGAKVGLLPESGGACLRVADDPDWSAAGAQCHQDGTACLLRLPTDTETVCAFIRPARPSGMIAPDVREQMAADIHEGYSRDARENLVRQQKNIAPWHELDATFKAANYGLIDHIEEKLSRAGLTLRLTGDRSPVIYNFTDEQLRILAEMEHGRWVVERLENGWTLGKRDDARKTRPQLIPWYELSEEEKEKDYNAIRQLPETLAVAGYEIMSAGE